MCPYCNIITRPYSLRNVGEALTTLKSGRSGMAHLHRLFNTIPHILLDWKTRPQFLPPTTHWFIKLLLRRTSVPFPSRLAPQSSNLRTYHHSPRPPYTQSFDAASLVIPNSPRRPRLSKLPNAGTELLVQTARHVQWGMRSNRNENL